MADAEYVSRYARWPEVAASLSCILADIATECRGGGWYVHTLLQSPKTLRKELLQLMDRPMACKTHFDGKWLHFDGY